MEGVRTAPTSECHHGCCREVLTTYESSSYRSFCGAIKVNVERGMGRRWS